MPVHQINAFEAPAINFVKNCLRHDRDPVVIYPEPDDFEEFTLKAGLIGVTAGTDVSVGQLLVNVRVEPDPEDFPLGFSRSGAPLPCFAMHSISMMVHPVAGMWVMVFEDEPWELKQAVEDMQLLRQRLEADGWSPDALPLQLMWVTRHPMTDAPDGSEEWDVTVSLDELVDLYEVLTDLQQCSSADRVLPILASMLNQGSWATLEPETTVWLPQHLIRNVRPHYIMDEARKSEELMEGLWELANQVLTYAERSGVPRDVKKLLKRTSRRLDGLLETTEMVGQH